MIQHRKSVVSLSTAAILCLAFAFNATAGTTRDKLRSQKNIETCIVEVNKNANYGEATRVVHWVVDTQQLSLATVRIRIETDVYSRETELATARYVSTCVTGSFGDVERFRIQPAEPLETEIDKKEEA